jgi:hypothetical protein
MLALPLLVLLAGAPGCSLPALAVERPFQPGELLRYEVALNGVHAGQTILAIAASGPGRLESSLEARQTSLGSNRFRARSWLAAATLRPGPFRDAQDGWGARRTTEADLERSPNAVRVEWHIGDRAGMNAYRRGPELLDFASTIPYLRAAALAPGAPLCFDVVGATLHWHVEGRVGGAEPVATPAGRYQALRLAGTMRRSDGQGSVVPLRLWIATEARRLPVAAEIDSPLGQVRAELAAIDG